MFKKRHTSASARPSRRPGRATPDSRRPLAALLWLAAAAAMVHAGDALASERGNRPAAKPAQAGKSVKPAPRASVKPGTRARTTAAAAAAAAATAAAAPLPAAGGEQLAATALAHFGEYACEFNQTLQVSLNLDHSGYVDVLFGNQFYVMKPILSSTGALRLEDVGGRMLLLQIAFKSMLMDVRTGRRVADECMHEAHRVAKRDSQNAPPQPGLGIAPAPAGAASAAASG